MKKIAYYPTPNEIVKIMIKLTNPLKNKTILDSGFGEGAFIDEILNFKFKKLIGVELDFFFFNKLKKKNKHNLILFNQDYLTFEKFKNFDLIIGNPPYITSDSLPPKIKENIINITGSGEGNIYYAFILKSIDLLKDNGELIYILPYDFFFNSYAKKLRDKMIEEGEFEVIIDLNDLKIFKNASPDTIIFKWVKRKKRKKNLIRIIKNIKFSNFEIIIKSLNDILKTNKNNTIFTINKISQFNYTQNIWSLNNFVSFKKNYKLSKNSIVGVGIVNGCEKIFSLSNKEIKLFTKNEKKLFVKTFIKSKNLIEYGIHNLNNNKYLFIDNSFKKEEDFSNFQNVWVYLLKNKIELENRYISKSNNWWNYLAIRNKKTMDESKFEYKIIVSTITRKENKWFSITNREHYFGGDVLFIKGKTQEETFFLFGFLNSKFFNDYYKKMGAKKGNRIFFNQKILNDLEIPNFSEFDRTYIIKEVEKMLKLEEYNFNNINKLISLNLQKEDF